MDKINRNKRNGKSKNKVLIAVLFIAILSIILMIFLRSDLFIIKKIELSGNYILLKDDIIDYSGITEEENLFKIKTKTIEENIKRLSYIKEVEISRKPPNTINIDVEERKDLAFVKNISMYQVVDIEGYVLRQVGEQDRELPTILGMELGNIKLGENIFDQYKVETLSDFIEEGFQLEIWDNIYSIDLEFIDNINIKLNNGIYIAFGPLDNVKYKLRLLDEILIDIKNKDIRSKKIIMNKGEHPIIITED